MDSEWQTTKPKRRTKPSQPVASNIVSNISVKKIPVSIIMQYESIFVDVTRELSNKFDDINKMLLTSTQYQDSKINHNIHNHNRWKLSNADSDDITKILACFNKLAVTNFDEVAKEIKKYNIIDIMELKTLVNNIYHKCISNFQFVFVNIKMIKKIIMEYSWIVHDESSRTITFRKYFVDYLETNFDSIINKIIDDEDDEDKEDFNKEERLTFMKIISAMYDNHILGTQLIRYIFTVIENAFSKKHKTEYMDMWLQLFKCVKNHWTGSNSQYIEEKLKFLDDNKGHFNVRTEVLINSALNEQLEEVEVQQVHVESHEYDVSLLIDSLSEYDNASEWYDSLLELEKYDLVIKDIINNLASQTTNLKTTFTLLKCIMSKNADYKVLVKDAVRHMVANTNNKSYITNASIILK